MSYKIIASLKFKNKADRDELYHLLGGLDVVDSFVFIVDNSLVKERMKVNKKGVMGYEQLSGINPVKGRRKD